MPVSQGNMTATDSVPHIGNYRGLEEDVSKGGAIRRHLYTVCCMGPYSKPSLGGQNILPNPPYGFVFRKGCEHGKLA